MTGRKPTKTEIRAARDPKKREEVLKEKGVKSGVLPNTKELHHVKPVAAGGKTTSKNTRIVATKKHKQIHKNRREKGET
jgi:hypothetical protein